jgi:hypothetical protein
LRRLAAIPASLSSRRTRPGTPLTSERGGTTTPCGTTAPAAMSEPAPMTAETLEGSPDVVVEDDGIGGADARNGSGLIGLEDRVEALGGHLEIRSEPVHGTCLHADIPLGRRQRWAGYPRRCLFWGLVRSRRMRLGNSPMGNPNPVLHGPVM